MDTKTKQAIDLYQKGDLKKSLSIFKTFKIGFTKEEQETISKAYEILTGKESFYKQLGIDTKKEVEKARDILKKKYHLKESEVPSYKTIKYPDGVYDGFIHGYSVTIPTLKFIYKSTTGYRNAFPIKCKVIIKNGLAKTECDNGAPLYSSEESKAYWDSLKPKELEVKNKADNMELQDQIYEKLMLDIEKGDTILTGKFKNKKVIVKDFGTDEKGQPTINGNPILKIRIKKLMKELTEDKIEGGKADGMSLEDIAQDHLQRSAPHSYADDTLFSTNVDDKEITYNALLDTLKKNFELGIKVEMEHTNDRQIAEEIAKDHLMEEPNYYQKLSTIEPMKESFKSKKIKLIESLLNDNKDFTNSGGKLKYKNNFVYLLGGGSGDIELLFAAPLNVVKEIEFTIDLSNEYQEEKGSGLDDLYLENKPVDYKDYEKEIIDKKLLKVVEISSFNLDEKKMSSFFNKISKQFDKMNPKF